MTEARLALRAVALTLAPLALLTLVSPWLPDAKLATAFLAFLVAAFTIVLAGLLAPRALLLRPRVALFAVLSGVACSLLSLALPPWLAGLVGALGVVTVACTAGVNVGARIESPGHILPVALLSAAVDLYSVTAATGPTHIILQKPTLLRLLTINACIPPSRTPEPQIGFGDVVFVALYVTVSARFSLSLPRTAVALFLGTVAAGLVAAALQAPIPALPMLGFAMLLAHREARRVPIPDRRATAFTAALLVASAARAWWVLGR